MTTLTSSQPSTARRDRVAVARELGERFAARAAGHDGDDSFVADNYVDLKTHRLFSAGVPVDLGGGGASHAELCEMLRTLGRSCGSTALALSMHTHLVAAATWRRDHDRAPVEPMLRRVAAEELVLVSSGGSDWLAGSGRARKVDGGYRIDARKIFSSGCPAGQLLVTSAVLDDPQAGPTVLHFAVALDSPGVQIQDTWHTLGMRATGSHDITLDDVFVPEAAIAGRRPQGKWHPLFHVITMIALPLIYAVYVGVAEAARDLAVRQAVKKRDEPNVPYLVGEMENELAAADMALETMIATAATAQPGPETTKRTTIARTLCGRAAIATVDKAMEVAGGGAFYRSLGLERLFRDVQGARYHPLQEKVQLRYAGRLALGLDIDG
jgi:alkylation response protein AidB-like acyl-CoA dehydrogenase